MQRFSTGILCLLLLSGSFSGLRAQEHLSKWVNPFVGTAPLTDPSIIGYDPPENWRVWAGLTYPGATLPNAMVQASPITAFHTGAGYQYEDTIIYAFTHTNKGHWNLCNLPVLPISGKSTGPTFQSHFSHTREKASPGYYEVYLDDYQVKARLTTSLHCAIHEYTFDRPNDRKIALKLSEANNRIRGWDIEKTGDHVIQGEQDMGRDKIYFYAILNTDIRDIAIHKGQDGYALLSLKDGKKPVVMKFALSFVSRENARMNLEAEVASKTFDQVRNEATKTWDTLLSRITVKGGTEKQKELFYSSLYRAFQWPALRSDVNGEYTDVKGNVVKKDFRYYTLPSLWDTYRNKLVLLSMLEPDVTTDVIKTLIDIGQKTNFIPTFFHGDHAAAFIAGAYMRGNHDFDVREAYHLLMNNATLEGGTRPYISEYISKGYISTPQVESPNVETKAKAGVAKTLEYAFDDYALSLLAKDLGDTASYRKLTLRSKNYRNVFDPQTRFMRGRLENGDWVHPFDPQYPYYEYMYREANAWQVSFFAPHDMKGLVELYGGNQGFESKLDSLFTLPWNPHHIARNVSGFIGQYCHGNQPDHEAPFSYYFIDKPQKSQAILDRIMNDLYGIGDEGIALSGMDDAGEMSAWYVFAAAGLYPFTSADNRFIITVPVFDEVTWELSPGHSFTQTRQGSSRHLTGIRKDGEQLNDYFITNEPLIRGGKLEVLTR